MKRIASLRLSFAAWIAVWAFWLVLTHDRHPTFALALVVTSCLVAAYASAAYFNHLYLIPKYWRKRRRVRYALALAAAMLLLTAAALAVIRVSYLELYGPDADPNGLYKHFAIDLFGMAVHMAAAGLVVWAFTRREADRSPPIQG